MNGKHELDTVDEPPEAVADAPAGEDVAQAAQAGDASLEGDEPGNEAELLKAEVAALENEVLRARADAENVRKRAERDVEAAHKYALERMVADLLPVKDSMDMGLSAAATTAEVEGLREGIELTVKMFDDFLEKIGVTTIDPAGEQFNPDFHEAMTMETAAEVAPGTVVRVMQRGFLLNGRLVRPALVVVARAPDENA